MKRGFFRIILLITCITLISGCNYLAASVNSDTQDDTITIRLAHHMSSSSGTAQFTKKFTDLVTERTEGKVAFILYPDSQLGGERDTNENVMQGNIHMTVISSPTLGWLSPTMNLLNVPYLFQSNETGYELLNGSIGEQLNQYLIEKSSIRIITWYAEGFRNVFAKDRSITTLEDWKGLKIRSPESDAYIGAFSALGGNPTPTPWNEVYTALQTGVVTAAEAPTDFGLTARFHEVARDLSLTNHIFLTQALAINDDFWNGLPHDVQKVIIDTAQEVSHEYLKAFPELEKEQINQIKNEGGTVHQPSEQEINRMRESVQPVWIQLGEAYGVSDLIEEIVRHNNE
ncbi:TRAP transporter substrate-binding protein [Halalkalibacterium ligniniphilum]|uniref:TRAP transporter substrate-binding protein n=1 Tax=Halalkalibacterium ligniniphilum TaxID=1134413 RepID=UPI00037E6DF9|nr:TRAP transporter substrate-binding protein [Halalkalibacterium ligniniphilum]